MWRCFAWTKMCFPVVTLLWSDKTENDLLRSLQNCCWTFNFFKTSIVQATPLLEFYSDNFYHSVPFKLLKHLKLAAKEVRGTQDTLDEVMVLLREQATRHDLDKVFKVISLFAISCSFQNLHGVCSISWVFLQRHKK